MTMSVIIKLNIRVTMKVNIRGTMIVPVIGTMREDESDFGSGYKTDN